VTGRRAFLAFIADGLSLAPAPARGQRRAKVSRVGVLSPFDSSDDAFLEVFRQGLRELGHVEGQNLTRDAAQTLPRWVRSSGFAAHNEPMPQRAG
jgi:hypothetical protein